MVNPKRKASKSSKKGNRRKKVRRTSLKSSRTVMEVDVSIPPNNYPPSNSTNSKTSHHPLKLFVDYNHHTLSSQLKDLHKDVIWCQHQAFFHPDIVHQVKLYEAGIVVDDVIQGYLNDCWLLGPLATLTSQHEIIRQLIRSVDGAEVPTQVEVSFWQLGCRKSVIVDNYFPCLPRRRYQEEDDSNKLYADLEPLYCKPNGPELWALYIEKAYATLHGSYQALHDGQDYEAMIDLTGCPAYSYTVRPLSLTTANQSIKNFEDLEKLVGHSGFITAISHDQAEDGTPIHQDQSLNNIGEPPVESTKNGEGIFPHHSYSILNTLRLPHIDSNLREECFKLIKLRNPHGKHEFTGRWSDRCNYWKNEQCQKALNDIHETIIDKDEGIFWMDFENFRKYFARVNACFPNGVSFNDYCLHWTNQQTWMLQGPITESVSFRYELVVPENPRLILFPENVVYDVLVFGLHQSDLRPFLRNDYSKLILKVFSKGELWQFKKGRHRQVQTDVLEFSPGVYHIELEIKCDANCVNRDQREYALTVHSTCADFKFTPCT